MKESDGEEEDIRNPTVSALRIELESLGLSSKGQLKQLKKRLRDHHRKSRAAADADADAATDAPANETTSELFPIDKNNNDDSELQQALADLALNEERATGKRKRQPFDWFCVFDVEATCRENNNGWAHEIIEFPVVLIDARSFSVCDEFRSFVRPLINPELTDFCTQLTGITQDQVENAPTFPEVLKLFESFLSKHQIKHSRMAFITDGPWDIRDFVRNQCIYSNIKLPSYLSSYIDLRRMFTKFYGRKEGKRANLNGMLSLLGMQFEGREHSGIDDTRNIARIVLRLMDEGCVFDSTKS
ncbi:3'-5' exoribonuclease 1, partial [Rhizoclosmatium hyalinum]